MPSGPDCIAIERFRVGDIIGRRQLVSLSFGPNHQPLLLTLSGALDYRITNALGASFPKLFASRTNDFRLHFSSDGQWLSIDLPSTPENYHSIQPLPGSRWLAVRGRAKDTRDLNAHIFDSKGCLQSSFHAGDGIQQVQVAEDGKIWVSYFDEGVYGDVPTGRTGLVAFGDSGELLFDFENSADLAGDISDCYALNVASSSDVWVYYYTDFPLVHLSNGILVDYWRELPVEGACALAVGDGFVVLAGSFENRNSVYRLRLSDMQSTPFRVRDETGKQMTDFQAFGRGSRLFLLGDTTVYELDASTLAP